MRDEKQFLISLNAITDDSYDLYDKMWDLYQTVYKDKIKGGSNLKIIASLRGEWSEWINSKKKQ